MATAATRRSKSAQARPAASRRTTIATIARPPCTPACPSWADQIDNDCDGRPERDGEVEDVVWYLDGDGDGFGVTNSPVGISCAPPPFPVLCLEWLPLEFCTAGDPKKFMIETPGMMSQHHQDGVLDFAIVAGDCDDINPFIHPGAVEVCDGQDDDCNGRADYRLGDNDFEDDDGDFVLDAACEHPTQDCDDMDPGSAPGRDEVCDRFDNDCDGTADEALESAELFPDRDARRIRRRRRRRDNRQNRSRPRGDRRRLR